MMITFLEFMGVTWMAGITFYAGVRVGFKQAVKVYVSAHTEALESTMKIIDAEVQKHNKGSNE